MLDIEWHQGIKALIADLNKLYTSTPALHELDCSPDGFDWLDASNSEQSVYAYCRYGNDKSKPVVVVCNFTPATHENYELGVPVEGTWREIFNSDASQYQGSGLTNTKLMKTTAMQVHGREHAINLRIPPLATVVLEVA